MIDVLHLYVEAGVAPSPDRRTDDERTNEGSVRSRSVRLAAGVRLRSTNPVVSHLPIEIRCNLY